MQRVLKEACARCQAPMLSFQISYNLRTGNVYQILARNPTNQQYYLRHKMSALVGYESSSSDEVEESANAVSHAVAVVEATHPLPDEPTKTNVSDEVKFNSPRRSEVVSDTVTLGPVLGPAAPTNGDMVEEESSEGAADKMSERDAIRYLTPAPVPMTSIPVSPPGSPDPAANARFARFLELKAKGVHINEDLCKKSSFLNPGLLTAMMDRVGMDEEDQYSTSLPLEVWNPRNFPEWAYKEGLLRSQKEITDKDKEQKKALSTRGKRVIDFAPSGASGGHSGHSSRRSTPNHQKKQRRP